MFNFILAASALAGATLVSAGPNGPAHRGLAWATNDNYGKPEMIRGDPSAWPMLTSLLPVGHVQLLYLDKTRFRGTTTTRTELSSLWCASAGSRPLSLSLADAVLRLVQPSDVEFVPMVCTVSPVFQRFSHYGTDLIRFPHQFWGDPKTDLFNKIEQTFGNGFPKAILGFNEPDQGGQANMSPQRAADVWRQRLQKYASQGIKLGAPAVVGTCRIGSFA